MHTRASKNLFSGRPGRRRGRKAASRFSLEQLEPRTLLSVLFTDNFNNDTGGSSGNSSGTIGSPGEPSFTTQNDVSLVQNAGPAGTNDTAVELQYQQSNEGLWPNLGMPLSTNFGMVSEYYVQFYVKITSNITGGMKFIKFFGSSNYPSAGNEANTTLALNYWSDLMGMLSCGPGTTTTNDSQAGFTFGGTISADEPNAVITADSGGDINIADGNWHSVQVHVKYDTSYAAHDGAYDVWVDGVHVLGVTGVTNRNDLNSNTWNSVSWGNYTNDPTYNPAMGPFNMYVDDVTISTSFISGTPPAAPTNVTPLPGNDKVVLNWTASSGAYSYNVFRSTSPGGEGSIPVAYGVSGTTWTDNTVSNNQTYYYTVTAVNTGGQSSASSEVVAQPVALALNVIGSPAAGTPTFIYSGGTWQLDGSGNINSSTSDNLGFAAESTTANTGGAMIVEIDSNSQSTSGDGGGIMWRDGTGQGAADVYVGWSYNGTLVMSDRTTTGGSGATLATASASLPVWVELVCTAQGSGDYTFSGYYSTNGTTWTLLDTTSSAIAMTNPMAGLAVANGQSSTADKVAFSNFSTPLGLALTSIGTPPAGTPTMSYSGGVWTLTGSGYVDGGSNNAKDVMGFAAQNVAANTSSVTYAQITSNSVGTSFFGGGIVFRDGTAQGATNVFMSWGAAEGAIMKERTTTGGTGTTVNQISTPATTTLPVWVALVCTAEGSNTYTFSGYYSTDGKNWILVDTTGTITMTDPMVGLAVVNTGSTTADTVTFANVSIGSVPATPAVPTGLAAVAAGTGVIGLTWNAAAGAASYDVYRSTTSGGEGTTPYATGITTTSWADTSATAGTKYYYTVTGVNGISQSGMSGEASTTAVAAPANLSATPVSSQINLAWASAAGASTYNVYRGTSPGDEGTTPVATGISTTTWTDTSVTAGTTYYYEVTGVNSSDGESDFSNEAAGEPLPSGMSMSTIGTPAVSTTYAYGVGTWTITGAGSVDASTADNAGFMAESVPANASNSIIAEITSNSVSTTNFGGGIMWRDGTAQGAINVYVGWSYGSGVIMRDRTTTNGSGATVGSAGSVTLPVWVKIVCTALGGNNYTFSGYYSTDDTNWTLLKTTGTISMTNPMAGLTVLNGNTTPADTVTFANLAISGSVPGQVSGLGATAGTGSVTLNWSTDSGATTYNVYRGTSSNGEGATPYATGISTTNWTDTAATNGTTYYYEVTGVNGSGEGAKSSEVSATPIAIPGSLSAIAGNNQDSLTWTSAAGATSYDIYRGTTSGGEGATPYATGISTTSWTDTSVTAGTTYYYEVTGVNSSGQGGKSSEASTTAVNLSLTTVGTPPAGTPSFGYSAGTWTLTGSGNVDGGSTPAADNFGFVAESMPANTSEVMYVEINSNSVSTTNFGGGITWRNGTAQGATNVYVAWSYGNGVWMKERTTAGQGPTTVKQVTGINLPVWVEVVCTALGSNNYTFTGYYKTGSTWIPLGTSSTIAMSNPMAGLTVVNADSTTADTVTFTNMDPHPLPGGTSAPNPISDHWTQPGFADTINFSDSAYLPGLLVNSDDASALSIASVALTPYLPAGWTGQDLGAVMPGWTADSNNTLNVTGTGSDIGGAFDQFNFASDSVTGDQTIHAEVTN